MGIKPIKENNSSNNNNNILSFLTNPSNNINYTFLTYMYMLGCSIGLLIYSIEMILSQKISSSSTSNTIEDDDDDIDNNEESTSSTTMKEIYNSIKGIYLIFTPFGPCFIWCLLLRYKWIQQQQQNSKEKNQ